ncbi:RagB/SusD family nutrient uptake outer membrane protein [Lacibacter luteus]|uniref:RagB/SusD family nutrient uptake outer membrane protein n=1 Tax=Lacibacter luteus TaxID=2508719 RepID=A0A4Q1CLC9_9BACT|nr:RagB/SusD family nutrient uptake outer membrane protein [Lacibacter luteus]RXK61803.1 RagB/SusD family nutrient uptake outer membrane protein [Lacibacter luteus]
MKQIKFLTYSLLVLFAVSFSSCKKWLALKPQDGIVKEEFWKTKEQVKASVIGIYSSMMEYSSGTYGNPTNYVPSMAELFFVWGESRADHIASATASSADDIALINANIQPTNVNANWRPFYRTINFCNTVIEKAPEVLANDNTFTQKQLDNYLSEALTVRALMYFYLARTFGDVPLKLDATLSDENITPIPKTAQAEIFAQVVKDLTAAEAKAVTTYGDAASDKGRVTVYTINAILADVYLWMEKYTESIAACDKVINSGKFGLIRGATQNGPIVEYNDAWFNTLYYNGNSNEGIFELQFSQQRLNPYFTIFSSSISARRWTAAADLMDRVFTVDYTNDQNYDIRGDGASVRAATTTVWKYVGANATGLRALDQSYAHWFFYRYADILLMKAEALNELGRGQEALDIVYTIRARANALDATDLTPAASDKNLIQDFILEERAREFCFEGKRWFDVLRNAKRNKYERIGILLSMVSISVPSNMQQSAQAKFKDQNSHYLPIYLYEMQTNKQLVQNPFYK